MSLAEDVLFSAFVVSFTYFVLNFNKTHSVTTIFPKRKLLSLLLLLIKSTSDIAFKLVDCEVAYIATEISGGSRKVTGQIRLLLYSATS